jgi:ADP-ribose pyrophosphatase YjhB (NUDIX family)
VGVLSGWVFCPRCGRKLTHAEGRVECGACDFVQYANPVPAVAALVVDGDGRLLLARRAHEPDAGRWDTPGGFLNEGEEPVDGLRRELREEAGVEIEPGAFVGMHLDRYGGEDEDTPILNLVWEASIVSGELEPADDVSELRWFPRDGLPPDDELAFRWLAPALRAWSSTDAQKDRGPANRPIG